MKKQNDKLQEKIVEQQKPEEEGGHQANGDIDGAAYKESGKQENAEGAQVLSRKPSKNKSTYDIVKEKASSEAAASVKSRVNTAQSVKHQGVETQTQTDMQMRDLDRPVMMQTPQQFAGLPYQTSGPHQQ